MKLHEVPEGSTVRILPEQAGTKHPPAHREFEESEVLRFSHIDGMYSLCYDKQGKPVHLVAWAEVEIVNE